jgi:hypothetical protein
VYIPAVRRTCGFPDEGVVESPVDFWGKQGGHNTNSPLGRRTMR